MSLAGGSEKSETITKHGLHAKDTGSPEVQIALLTKRIVGLSQHFEKHVQDKHSRRGLLALVSQRKRLLSYLRRESVDRYRKTVSDLGLRK